MTMKIKTMGLNPSFHFALLVGAFGAGFPQELAADQLTVLSTDFDGGLPSEFSGVTSLEQVPNGFNPYGPTGNVLRNTSSGNPAAATFITLSNLPAHTGISIRYELLIIDSWDGSTQLGGAAPPDFFNLTLDGVSKFSATFDNFRFDDQTTPTSNKLTPANVNLGYVGDVGGGIGNDQGQIDYGQITYYDSVYNMGAAVAGLQNMAHTANSAVISLFASGSGWQGGGDESWAIDHVVVTLEGVGVVDIPEHGDWIGFAVPSLVILELCRRRRGHIRNVEAGEVGQ